MEDTQGKSRARNEASPADCADSVNSASPADSTDSPISADCAGAASPADSTESLNSADCADSAQPYSQTCLSYAQITALWVGSFFDELVRWGVHNVVVSPGSRSTPLAMAAYELSGRRPSDLRLYVDIDERGAAFFALGLAKASGQPVALVCTSGTAVANFYPAVIEAETSRVPLIVLTGDRPPRLQGLGAPQTTDQVKIFGDHVRAFRMMPLPSARRRDVAFVRQAAREACIAACGGHAGVITPNTCFDCVASRGSAYEAGPVHINFPFEEPLKPNFEGIDAFESSRSVHVPEQVQQGSDTRQNNASQQSSDLQQNNASQQGRDVQQNCGMLPTCSALDNSTKSILDEILQTGRVFVLAGEGTCTTINEAQEVVAWARAYDLPLLADPLSGLRCVDDPLVIDNYDEVCVQDNCPMPNVTIRFGRYPVSKSITAQLARARDEQSLFSVVVDMAQTRDFNSMTDLFIPMTPLDFVRSFASDANDATNAAVGTAFNTTNATGDSAVNAAVVASDTEAVPDNTTADSCTTPTPDATLTGPVFAAQRDFAREWITLNNAAYERILAQSQADDADQHEGAYIRKVLELAPAQSCVFSANSLTIREVDTNFTKSGKPLCVLCNRGQNGIDGTVSTALGAAHLFDQTTLVVGDLALLHDLNALAMQHELLAHPQVDSLGNAYIPSVIIVLFNNNGGAIFNTLPQASDEPYFERLFLTPQDVHFEDVADAFQIPYHLVQTVDAFNTAYSEQLGVPGISLIEVRLPSCGECE